MTIRCSSAADAQSSPGRLHNDSTWGAVSEMNYWNSYETFPAYKPGFGLYAFHVLGNDDNFLLSLL